MSESVKKVLLDISDYNRALLSDTTPAELPIPIGNEGFYLNVRDQTKFGAFARALIQSFVLPQSSGKKATEPLCYKIVKDQNSLRKLSLPHPRSQLEVCNFYSRYDSLLSYYCGTSSFSIWRPVCTASKYYLSGPLEEKNELKFSTISTLDRDKFTKHPASFFAYSGYDRLHKFFGSRLFDMLERQFLYMASHDVSKCFHSIYTHSITWATRSITEAKRNTSSEMYGASFDRLMQSLNRNETNGIVIGPEVSRIFAETIFSAVDKELEGRLKLVGLYNNKDYAGFRYVDNYYFFCRNMADCDVISSELAECLDEYKLHLNPAKSEVIHRPFANAKSSAIQQANLLLNDLIDNLTETVILDSGRKFKGKRLKLKIPKRIFSSHRLMGSFVQRVRIICVDSGLGYEAVIGYLLAAFKWRTQTLTKDGKKVLAKSSKIKLNSGELLELDEYHERMACLLNFYVEASFHLFSLGPSVNASLDISYVLVLVAEFLNANSEDEFVATREKVQLWLSRLVESSSFAELDKRPHSTSIEILNVICATKPFKFGGSYYLALMNGFNGVSAKVGYFEIVSKLFVLENDPTCRQKILDLILDAENFLLENPSLSTCSERLHLFLDLMSCPFISIDRRRKFVRRVLQGFNDQQRLAGLGGSIKIPHNVEIEAAISDFETSPWFATWDAVNLRRLIEKKELKRSYA